LLGSDSGCWAVVKAGIVGGRQTVKGELEVVGALLSAGNLAFQAVDRLLERALLLGEAPGHLLELGLAVLDSVPRLGRVLLQQRVLGHDALELETVLGLLLGKRVCESADVRVRLGEPGCLVLVRPLKGVVR
jgi:hypothetical protein